jgi:periplasmic protein TonB
MSVAERHLDDSSTADDLSFVLEQAKAGNFADAQQALARAKSNDPRNIFIMALEKQIARLRLGGVLPREKSEIIESLPGLIQRAKSDRQGRDDLGEQLVQSVAPTPPPVEKKDPRLKMVVDQYFKHADDWVRRGDFEAALKEVERVLLIDPESRVGKEYLARLKQLIKENAAPEAVAQSAALRHESAVVAKALPPEPAPARVSHPAPPIAVPAQEHVGKKKVALLLSVAIVLVIGLVAGAMMLRPNQAKYKPGMLYITENPVATTSEEVTQTPVQKQEQEPPATALSTQVDESPDITAPKIPAPEPEPVVKQIPAKKTIVREATPEPVAEPKPEPKPEPKSEPIAPVSAAPVQTAEKAAASSEGEKSTPFIPVESPPKIVNLEQPVFTNEELAAGIKGDVVVKVQIDKNGKPVQAKVMSSTNKVLNGPVVDAVMRSTYTAGVMSSGPVTTWMTIPMRLK